jgi:hypothetical protein
VASGLLFLETEIVHRGAALAETRLDVFFEERQFFAPGVEAMLALREAM